MDEKYDYIVLGTGLVECILSSLLSMEGKKVLHMDRNDYYGGECASLNLSILYKKFKEGAPPPTCYGRDKDYNVDLVPKFIMAGGELARILAYTDVTRYLEFKQIAGSYVYRDGYIYKVPATESEAFWSSLFGIFEKKRAMSFFEFIKNYDQEDASTHKGMDLKKVSMMEVYKKFSLDPGIQDFIGHAMALHVDDSYVHEPAWNTYKSIVLYMTSMNRFGKSPYIYPMYGLGELPQSFARLSAIYGGTYMLDKEFTRLIYNEHGQVMGVQSGNEIAQCKAVIGDPSYFPEKVRKIGKVIRAICLLKGPIPGTSQSDSVQVIIPQRQVDRQYDIYIACVSHHHQVCAAGYYVAIVSTIIETANPEKEISPGLTLLGPILEKFISITDLEVPMDDGTRDQVFISNSYDASSHFETVCHNVIEMYQKITGHPLELKKRPLQEQEQEQSSYFTE